MSTDNNDLENILSTINKIEPTKKEMESNISAEEKKALQEIKVLVAKTIEIKKADKSDTLVIMDKQAYRDNLIFRDHLNTDTYEKADIHANKDVYRKLENLVEKHSNCLTKSEKKVILDKNWKDAKIYALPKIHKCQEIKDNFMIQNSEYMKMEMPDFLKGRPIHGGPQAVTQGGSKLLEKILSPLVPTLKSYIKDEWDFVRKFPKLVHHKATLLTCDIVSLYTSIPTDLGIKALDF